MEEYTIPIDKYLDLMEKYTDLLEHLSESQTQLITLLRKLDSILNAINSKFEKTHHISEEEEELFNMISEAVYQSHIDREFRGIQILYETIYDTEEIEEEEG